MKESAIVLVLAVATGCAAVPCATGPSDPGPLACGDRSLRATPFDPGRMTSPTPVSWVPVSVARRAIACDVRGRARVRCRISARGRVTDCCIEESVRYMDASLVETFESRRYTPATLDGKPIEVDYPFEVEVRPRSESDQFRAPNKPQSPPVCSSWDDSRVAELPPVFDPQRMKEPVYVAGPMPQYTSEALEARIQGRSRVRCVLGVDGRVSGCCVVESLRYMDRPLVDTFEARRYLPATLDGAPIEVRFDFVTTLRMP